MAQRLGIIQSRGLGDIVISLPIAHYYHKQGWEIHWPICEEFRTHFDDTVPWVNWHSVETDASSFFLEQPRKIFKNLGITEELCLYQALTGQQFHDTAHFQHVSFDQHKYQTAQVPFLEKWRLADCVTRQRDREDQLLERIKKELKGRPYLLIHVSGSDHRAGFDSQILPPDMAAIEINQMTDSFWDWFSAIEQAELVITVDSVYSNAIDQMSLLDDDSRYFIPRSHIQLTPTLGNYWTWLTNTNLPQQAKVFNVK